MFILYKSDTKSHPTLGSVIEELRLEQSKTEIDIINLKHGMVHTNKASKLRRKKAANIANMVLTYKTYPNVMEYFDFMSLNMGDEKLVENN